MWGVGCHDIHGGLWVNGEVKQSLFFQGFSNFSKYKIIFFFIFVKFNSCKTIFKNQKICNCNWLVLSFIIWKEIRREKVKVKRFQTEMFKSKSGLNLCTWVHVHAWRFWNQYYVTSQVFMVMGRDVLTCFSDLIFTYVHVVHSRFYSIIKCLHIFHGGGGRSRDPVFFWSQLTWL